MTIQPTNAGIQNRNTDTFRILPLLIVVLCCFIHLPIVKGQDQPLEINSRNLTYLTLDTAITQYDYQIRLHEIPHDILRVAISPFSWNKKELSYGFASFLVTGLAFSADRGLNDFMQRNQTPILEDLSSNYIRLGGEGYSLAGALAVTFIGSKIGKNDRLAYVTYRAGEAWIITAGATGLLKLLFHRHRPEENPDDPFQFDGPSLSRNHVSFVSGHTSSAFAIATVFSQYYKEKPWVALTSYSLATLVGLSRMYDNKHWFSDVIGGALLGTWIGYTLTKPDQGRKHETYSVYPIYSSEMVGLSVVLEL